VTLLACVSFALFVNRFILKNKASFALTKTAKLAT